MEINSRNKDNFSIIAKPPWPHNASMEPWAKRVNEQLARHDWTVARLARKIGANYEALAKQLQGKVKNPRGDVLDKIAGVLGVSVNWIRTGRGNKITAVPPVGYVGAGEEFFPFDDNHDGEGLDLVGFDLDAADPVAVRVRGDSMVPVYRPGDHLFCSREKGRDIDAAIGQDCVVRTRDGIGYIKRFNRAGKGFVLKSYNVLKDDIEIAREDIDWIAPVVFIRRAI